MQTIINPLVVSMGPTNETNITPIPMTAHGGGIKKIIGIVAAVAVPFAAPAIASAIGLSAAIGAATTATIGAVAGSAIVGAGLGAITAAVTGQSVARGALFGGIAGGIGGYGARANITTPSGTPTTGPSASFMVNSGKAAQQGLTAATTPSTSASFMVDSSKAAQQGGLSPATDAATSASFMVDSGKVAQQTAAQALSNTAAAAPETFAATMKSKLSSAGQMLVDRIASPEALANAALKVAGSVISDAMVEPPSTAEAQAGIAAYERELALLKERDEAAFNEKLEASKQYMVQAGYYDPQYFANQAANNAAIAEGRKLREYQRTAGLRSGGVSEGELRRAALAGTQNIQSSFDRGFQQGVGLRNTAITTATGLIPSAPTSGLNATGQLANMRAALENAENRRKDEERSNIQEFFGAFNADRGQTDEEKEKQYKITQEEIRARGIAATT
jgi:hypothetical protein